MEKVLDIKDVSFGYQKANLIYDKFKLELYKGEIVALVGPSGSGKSTLFELICGQLKPFTGEINRHSMSCVYQDPYNSFHPTYTIFNQIKEVCVHLNELNWYLKELNLDQQLLYKKPHELSGGQLQRLSILRALLMKPSLLLVDEPTSALDNLIAKDVIRLLMKFVSHYGMILITHDLNLASFCSNRIVHLE